jgi:hypothetical protein
MDVKRHGILVKYIRISLRCQGGRFSLDCFVRGWIQNLGKEGAAMKRDEEKCSCRDGEIQKICPQFEGEDILPYWCEVCRQAVADKRCPLCGLKASKLGQRKMT